MAQCGGNPSRHAATKPTQRDLKVVAKRAGNNWSSLLISLDIPWATIESIKTECPTNLWEACMKGLVIWLKGGVSDSNEPVTFGTLFAALKDSGMADCVSLLVDRLDKRSTPHPRPTHQYKDEDLSTPTSERGKQLTVMNELLQEMRVQQSKVIEELELLGREQDQAKKDNLDQGSLVGSEKEKDTQLRENATQIAKLLEEIQRLKQASPASSSSPAKPFKPVPNKEKDTQLREKDTPFTRFFEEEFQRRLKISSLASGSSRFPATPFKPVQNKEKDTVTQLQEKDTQIAKTGKLLEKIQRPSPASSSSPAKPFKPVQNKPPRNWRKLKCQKTRLKSGGYCYSIAVQGDVVCVGVKSHVLLFSKTSGAQVCELGSDQIVGAVLGVAFIDEDTIVVSSYDKRLRTYTTKRQLVHTFDSGKDGFSPRGLTVGPDGHIFVCDYGNHCVCVFNVDGKLLSSFGSEGRGVGHFNRPWDVCMDGEGLLFISDRDNSRICVHSVEGAFIREFPTPRSPYCVAATHCNHLVVSSYSSHTVMIMTTSGQLVHEFGGRGSGPGQFICPQGVAVDSEDCVYVCDGGNERVQVY